MGFDDELEQTDSGNQVWKMEGYYLTSTASTGKHSLRIYGTLRAPKKLEFTNKHFAVFVIGNNSHTESLWCGWEPANGWKEQLNKGTNNCWSASKKIDVKKMHAQIGQDLMPFKNSSQIDWKTLNRPTLWNRSMKWEA